MGWLAWSLVILLTALVTILGAAVLTGRDDLARLQLRAKLDQAIADQPSLPGAGRLEASYGPFPVDTGPLLLLSEQAAANVALEREIRQRCAEAEAKIPPRWR